MTVAYWQGRQWRWGVASGANAPDVAWHGQAVADNDKPLDDRLGTDGSKWKIAVTFVAADGKETSDRTEVHVKEYERSLRVGNTPDLVVEMNAGMLARNILRARKQ